MPHASASGGPWTNIQFDLITDNLWERDTTFTTVEGDDAVALFDGRPLPAQEDTSTAPRYNFANRLLPQLQPGDNAVEFRVVYRCNLSHQNMITVASSTVNIQVIGNRGAAVQFERNRLPERLQAHMLRAVSRYIPSRYVVVRAIATSAWSVEYHPINGRPVSRTADGYVFLRDESAGTCAFHGVSVTQNARSRTAYEDAMEGSSALGDPSPIPCASIPRR